MILPIIGLVVCVGGGNKMGCVSCVRVLDTHHGIAIHINSIPERSNHYVE